MKCTLCGEEFEQIQTYCPNCNTYLYSEIEPSLRNQDFKFNPEMQSLSDFTLSVPPTEYGMRPDEAKFHKKFVSLLVDGIYIIISIFIINELFSILTANNQALLEQLIPGPKAGLLPLVYLCLLFTLSLVRGWINLHLDPPDPFPEGYRTLNTILGIIILPIFFVLLPYFFAGLGITFLLNLIILIWFYVSPSRERKKALMPPIERIKQFRSIFRKLPEDQRKSILETLQNSPKIQERLEQGGISNEVLQLEGELLQLQDKLTKEEEETLLKQDRNSMFVQKSASFEVVYKIGSLNDKISEEIIGTRSKANRLAIYIIFLIFFFPVAIPILLIFNLFWLPRRIAIIALDGNKMGLIKGSLLFNRWKISRFYSGLKDIKVRLNLINFNLGKFPKNCGTIKTTNGSLRVTRVSSSEICVYDQQNTHVLSVITLDSIYVRKKFRIWSDNFLDFYDTSTIAICIIERFYRPESRSSN